MQGTDASALSASPQLLVLSAETESALDEAARVLRGYLEHNPSVPLTDIAHTLQMRAAVQPYRRVLVCKDRGDALAALSEAGSKRVLSGRVDAARRPVVLLLPGVGDQYVGMGHELYLHWKVFKTEVDRCAQILEPHLGIDIREVLYPANEAWRRRGGGGPGLNLKQMLSKSAESVQDPDTVKLNRTRFAQPALFTIEYAMARLLQSIGIQPDAIVGHSMGEYVAACLAGVFSLEDALRLIAVRASLVDELPQGAMLSVLMSEQELLPLLGADLSVSLLNGPNNCVVAGTPAAVDELERRLNERDVISRRVQNGHAFHTKALDPILEVFQAQAGKVRFGLPRIPYASNVIGDWITAGFGSEGGYWAQHATRPARFNDMLGRTWGLGDPILIECGPGRTLSVLAAQHPGRKVSKLGAIYTLRQNYENESDAEVLLRAIGKVWLSGAAVDWSGITGSRAPHLSPLPELLPELLGASDGPSAESPSERAAEPLIEPAGDAKEAGYVAPRNDLEISLTRVCERVLGLARVGITDNFFELGGHSLAVIRLIMEMKQATGLEIDLGEVFRTPTILDLVSNLGANARKSASIVVPLQPKGDAAPIFCICGIDIYRDFANSVGENQPVCGVYVDEERAIINEVMDGKTSGVSIDRLVDAYDAAIVRFRPQGPYRLAGLSFGGMLAVELASKMRKRGAAVEFVFLFDTLLPEGRRRRWSSWMLRQLREMTGSEGRRKARKLFERLRGLLLPKAAAVHHNEAFYQEFAGRQRAAFFEAEKKWHVRTEIDFPVILFRASQHDMWGEDLEFAEDYGWRRHVGDRLHILPVIGGHRSIIEAPNVAELGRLAQQYLRESSADLNG
jgi:malonyl CoA-acyl carrier protein transacylase/thioesterase domain-containing protein/acyl carrier protein